jgi:hypothetical protein
LELRRISPVSSLLGMRKRTLNRKLKHSNKEIITLQTSLSNSMFSKQHPRQMVHMLYSFSRRMSDKTLSEPSLDIHLLLFPTISKNDWKRLDLLVWAISPMRFEKLSRQRVESLMEEVKFQWG